MSSSETAFTEICARIAHAASQQKRAAALLAVSKTKPAAAVRELAALGQRRFGENYVQEALAKQRELVDLALEWHLIGPLQSNKCREAAEHFDWLQTLDRLKLIAPLARFRPAARGPLNVLIQVNVDDETSKSGCRPEAVGELARAVAAEPRLQLRGLMAIPAPHADFGLRRAAFARLRGLFETLQREHPGLDTLSMGMSEDFELAIAEGATLVRIGSALFGARS
ncbi:MAG: YggS family pyridoxal phosphate-dependent enzyme [Rhodanobacteraceae bacterium]|nr:YggS family pyridoxal phosphate-dependent enzyme [Rhodanobacteraceae bacterium]